MAQVAELPEAASIADGGTASFPIPFTFADRAEVEVVVVDGETGDRALQTLGVHYLIPDADWTGTGGEVVFQSGYLPADDARVERRRVTPPSQDDAFGDDAQFRPAANESAFDKQTRLVAEAKAVGDRAMTTPIGEPGLVLPLVLKRRGKVLGFDSEGRAIPVSNSQVAVAEDLQASTAARQGAEEAAAVADNRAGDASDAADAAELALDQATAAKTAAQTYRNEAEAFVTALPNGPTYATDAAGRAAVADGAEYWLRTGDGPRLRIRTNSSSSTDWLDAAGQNLIVASINGVRRRRDVVRFDATDDGTFNSYSIRPHDHSVDLNALGDFTQITGIYTIPKTNNAGSGALSLTLYNGDGTFMWTRQMLTAGNNNLTPGEHVKDTTCQFRIMDAAEDAGLRFMILSPPDPSTKKVTRLMGEVGDFAMMPSPDRPVKYGALDALAYFVSLRPPPGCYLAGEAPKHSDLLFADVFDMGVFQADDPSKTFQGYGSRLGAHGLDETVNLRFGEVDGGQSTRNGLPSSTFESVPFTGDLASSGSNPAKFPAQGRGHGFCRENVDAVTMMRNDVTTARVVTAATKANPMVLTVASGGMAMTAGMKFALQGVAGMTQLNGLVVEVASVAGTAITTTTNSTGFGTFTSHGGSIDLMLPLDDAGVADGFKYGDRLTIDSTLLLEAPSADGLSTVIPCRAHYRRTIEPAAKGWVRFETRFDPDGAGVTVDCGLKRAVMLPYPIRNVNRMRVRRAGVWDDTVYEIDLRDGSSTGYGRCEARVFWHTTDPGRLTAHVNNLGYGVAGDAATIFSHWEDDGGGRVSIPATFAGYVANNNWGPKDYDGILEYASVRDMTGIQWGADYSIASFVFTPTDTLTLDDVLDEIDAIIPGLAA